MRGLLSLTDLMQLVQDMQLRTCTAALCRSLLAALVRGLAALAVRGHAAISLRVQFLCSRAVAFYAVHWLTAYFLIGVFSFADRCSCWSWL